MESMVTGIDIASVLPAAIAAVFGIVVLFLEVYQRPSFDRAYLGPVTAMGAALTGLAAFALSKADPVATFGGMNHLDSFGMVLAVLFSVGAGLAALVAPNYLAEHRVDRGEYHALILFALSGMVLMATAGDFAVFFLGLEIQGVAVYALAAYLRPSARSAEAGMKYFIIGAFASALLVYGIALVYGATGTTNLAAIGDKLALGLSSGQDATPIPLASFGLLLILAAFMVKVAAAPFHMWAPDAYTGSPTPAVGFLAAAVKLAGFGALIRVLATAFYAPEMRMGAFGWVPIVFWIALASMIVGNFAAIVQTNVKRMLAYSSVAHAGYMLVAVVAMGFGAGNVALSSGVIFYGFAYTFGTVGAFGALAYLGKRGMEAERYDDLNGLGFKYPWLGAALTIFMLSSAGIPPAAGFIGKFLVFKSAVDASVAGAAFEGNGLLIALVVAGIVTSVAGVYYYLRVIVHLYMKKPVRASGALPSMAARVAIAACAALTIWFGVFPGKLVDLSERAIADIVED